MDWNRRNRLRRPFSVIRQSPGTTDTQVFLQERIGLWTFWVFALCFGFYLTNVISWPFLRGLSWREFVDVLLERGNLLHVAASLFFGGVWVLTTRVTVSMSMLCVIDIATLLFGCALYAAMSLFLVRQQLAIGADPAVAMFVGLLACANTVVARAITVPSTPARTAWASVAAMLPLPAIAAATDSTAALVNITCWCAVSISVATVGSRVIFGLRRDVERERQLGQYTLEEQIGAGGMGVVYRASHAMLRRPTAIKLLPPDRGNQAALARFEREVQITSQLSHPNTVAIYDYGRTPDGVFYYAMEYLDGINLEDLVRRFGTLPAGRVVSIMVQVCGALAEAHGRGLVHRDVKPANVILTERGGELDVAKVVDFGLVKPFASDTAQVAAPATSVLAGTPLYMAPESINKPETTDPRSDLYALGAVGYFMLTGHAVFDGRTVFDILNHHVCTEPMPPSKRGARDVPPDLERVILECLRKNPEERPADAGELRKKLRQCASARTWTHEDAAVWWRTFRA